MTPELDLGPRRIVAHVPTVSASSAEAPTLLRVPLPKVIADHIDSPRTVVTKPPSITASRSPAPVGPSQLLVPVAGAPGPAGPQGPVGDGADIPDLTLIFENGLV